VVTDVPLPWLGLSQVSDGWQLFAAWPDGECWSLCTYRDLDDATHARSTILAETRSWSWASPVGGPLLDPQVPLIVLASIWRSLVPGEFNTVWCSAAEAPDRRNATYRSVLDYIRRQEAGPPDSSEEDIQW
jgi:hypothetical protein